MCKGANMTREEKQKICDNIFDYIAKELDEWIDSDIFTQVSLERLGELYYNRIISVIDNADIDLINAVIKTIAPKYCEHSDHQEEYYLAICKIMGITRKPADMLADVEKEYNELFVQKYSSIIQKYQAEREQINVKLNQAKLASDTIKNAPASYSFTRDISTDELQLYELSSICNELRTRKEMLDFAIQHLKSKLLEFCDMQDIVSIEQAKMKKALYLSKTDYDAEISFLPYRGYLEIVEEDIDRPYALFFKVKLYVITEKARKTLFAKKRDEEKFAEYNNYINQSPKIEELNLYKNTNPEVYNTMLNSIICNFSLLEDLKGKIESSICLRERKWILLKAIEMYDNREYGVFNNILPIQIEGMFADFLRDTTIFLQFSKINIHADAVLKDKIRILQEVKSDIYPEAVEYFMYYFNNMIRNKVAHGRYLANWGEGIQDEIFSKELLLDMCMLVHMLTRKSETEKMYRFIHNYQEYYRIVIRSSEHPCFEALFNDMIGDKLIAAYDSVEKYRPIQVAYWLVNPYYEKIFGQVADKSELLGLRTIFLSKEFWEYVLENLNDIIREGFDYRNINKEFKSVVNGLFKCPIADDVRKLLGKVSAALTKIQLLEK